MSSSSCSSARQFARPRPPALARLRSGCLAAWLAAAPLGVLAVPAPAAQQAAPGWRQALGAAQTLGEGDLHRWGFRIYHARLVAERAPKLGAEQDDEPFALELTYYRAISRERIVAASLAEMQRLAGGDIAPERLAAWRAELEHGIVDVNPGDTLTGVYVPGHGVRFYRGDALLADIPDQALAQAFFGIWLDPRTSDAGLRARLLGARG